MAQSAPEDAMSSENSGSVAATNWLAWSTTWPHLRDHSITWKNHRNIGGKLNRMRLGFKESLSNWLLDYVFSFTFFTMLPASLYVLVLSLIIACHSCGSISYFFLVFSKSLGAQVWFLHPGIQWCFGTSASFATCKGTKAVMRLCRQVHVCRCQTR